MNPSAITPAVMAKRVTFGALEMLLLAAGAWLLFGSRKAPVVPLAPWGALPAGLPPGSRWATTIETRLLLEADEIGEGWTVVVVPVGEWGRVTDPREIGPVLLQGGEWAIRSDMVARYMPPTGPTNTTPAPTLDLFDPEFMADYYTDPQDGRRLPVHRAPAAFG